MCGVIVVDAGRSRSTCLEHDAYIHDHCLGYHHDYLLFYQLPSSNLSTHRMLFSREKPLVKTMPPGSTLSFTKTLKILAAILFYLFYFLFLFNLSIYHIQFNLAIYRREIDNLSFALGARVCCLCAHTANEVLRDSPTGSITLVS